MQETQGDKEMVEHDRLMDLVNRIRSEKESDVPAGKIAERIELLKAVSMLDDMYKLHMTEDTAEISRLRFETTGKRRNYGPERRDIIEFGDLLKERLELYFSGR
jgi:hypothetical protein